MIRRDDATERQVRAARPSASTWLAANAGSGKTRVLTDRVARLLLHEVPPEKVLCLTYTKAAASEMQNRLFKRLGEWAMMPDAELTAQLRDLGEEHDLSASKLTQARTLFAQAIETPGGLKIQTIHSFCASLLRRFPLEAGVSPQFAEMEDRASALMRADIIEGMADGPEAALVRDLAAHMSDQDYEQITAQISRHREGFAPPQSLAGLLALFGLPGDFNADTLRGEVFLGDEGNILSDLAGVMADGGKTDQKHADALTLIGAPDLDDLPALEGIFLTGATAKEPFTAKIGKVPTKALQTAHPALMDRLEPLMLRLEAARPRRLALDAARKSAALHAFAGAFLPRYAEQKERAGQLDFDDLVLKARDLLRDPAVAEWVLYRLDGGIDHILVDEAQDTSPAQWDVVDRLAQEFTSGDGARADTDRTIFVVGDKKQSIYSFQGADPAGFDQMKDVFDDRLTALGKDLQALTLEYSFRSSSAVLTLVDRVFDGQTGGGFGADGRHRAFKSDLPGRVDLWPLVEPVDDTDGRHWTDPVDRAGATHHSVVLANQVADQIDHILKSETLPVDNGAARRPVTAGDILVLVQRRSDLFAEIIRACKARGLAIAGADRLKVGAELAVRDLAALLRFLDTPEDDLSLAEALKSPLLGWDEQALFTLAHHRPPGSFLWEALRTHSNTYPETMALLQDLRDQADFLRPYDLIERILTRHDGRRRLLARLGTEAEDGINALLSQALGYERSDIPSLTGFLQWIETDELEIKRQVGSGGDLIRVMTVHGSKGLEAPIVILPDTAMRQNRPETGVIDAGDVPLWSMAAAQSPDVLTAALDAGKRKRAEENQRLLYVALTRAETWLIVAAAGKLDSKGTNSWYQQVQQALGELEADTHPMPGGKGLRYSYGDWDGGAVRPQSKPASVAVDLPAHLLRPPPPVVDRPKAISPSDLGGAKALPGTDGLDEAAAKARGTALHLLLEHLPDLPPSEWEQRAARLLAHVDPAVSNGLLTEARKVLSDASLAALFAPDALAEVDVTGDVNGRVIAGQIDRLIVGPDRVRVIDFKTNATVPETVEAVPEGLLRQMGAYAHVIAQIYPDRQVETAILWTRTARLMTLPHDLVMAALHRAPQLDVEPSHT